MQNADRLRLLSRVAHSFVAPERAAGEKPTSILSLAATSYSLRPLGDATVPTGFDPLAIALFEAIVEGAYLVANADGVFDEAERRAFEGVVVAACGGTLAPAAIEGLVAGLRQQLRDDGLDRRIEAVARAVTKREQAEEVIRVGARLAQASEGVGAAERAILERLAAFCGLGANEVDTALTDAASIVEAAP